MNNIHLLFTILIILLAVYGFSISFYIYRKKNKKKKLVCPMRSDCDTVIHSDYSKVIGIPVEILGMIYYFIIIISYTGILFTQILTIQHEMILLGISMCSVLFSIYLVSIQAFVVKHWCIWCLSSAIAALIIFVLSYWNFIS